MELEAARRAAHARGATTFPRGDVEQYDQTDVADLIYAVLDVTHPVGAAPDRRYQAAAHEAWQAEQEAVRGQVWDAFVDGLLELPFRPLVATESIDAQ